MTGADDIPVARVVKKVEGPGGGVWVACPYCEETHVHGAPLPGDGPDHGHRASHCEYPGKADRADKIKGYYVREVEE